MNIKELENKYFIDIMISSRDRHSELALLLQSLRTQSFKKFNVFIYDDNSGDPIINCYFLQHIFNRMRLEGHYVKILRGNVSFGICNARQKLIDEVNKSGTGNLSLRCDDDVILESDYLFKLLKVIEQGYDMASGIVPLVGYPEFKREVKFVEPIINRLDIDDQGNITYFGDDCGYAYLEEKILPAHHFRTNLLYKSEINKKVQYEKGLSPVGFREESFFGLRACWLGYKLGVHLGAVTFHFATPSGGCRYPNYADLVRQDDQLFKKWFKNKYNKLGDPFGRK